MSVQEFEQADAEVMAVVNGHARPEAEEAAEEIMRDRIATPHAAPGNDTEEGTAPMREAKVAGVCREDPEAAARRKLREEEMAELERKWNRIQNRRTVICVALCVVIAAALLATLAKPELLIPLVSVGVISCSVVAGIAVDRWSRRKVW